MWSQAAAMSTKLVEASPFIHEGGQFIAENDRDGRLPAEQVLGMVERYETRLEDLVEKVTDQSLEVVDLTRTLEVERRAALGARHRLQVAQLEASKQIDEITHGAERAELSAALEVQRADSETLRERERADRAEATIEDLRARLAVARRMAKTPWYAFKQRTTLGEELMLAPATPEAG